MVTAGRQRPRAAPPAHRAPRRGAGRRGLRLLDGRRSRPTTGPRSTPTWSSAAIVVCGSARTAVHNRVFLSGLLRLLEAAPEHLGGGRFSAEPVAALRAFAHVYAGWGLARTSTGRGCTETALGAPGPRDVPRAPTGSRASRQPAPRTSTPRRRPGTTPTSRRRRPARRRSPRSGRGCCCCPARPTCTSGSPTTRPSSRTCGTASWPSIPSIWGHRAGSPADNPEDLAFLKEHVRRWLDS